jgi:hypothetical protein
MMKRFFLFCVVLLIGVGCGENDPPPVPPVAPVAIPSTPPPSMPVAAAKADDAKTADAKTAESSSKADDKKPDEPAEQPGIIVGKAEVGVGAKGHYSEGIITTPVSTIFRAEEMIAFKIQIPQAMNLFKAENNRGPKTHEEFMEKIIKANMIPLPELPEGQRFLFDPKTQQLMVEQRTK